MTPPVANREPTGSRQHVAYVRARQQGHPRSFAAAYAGIGEGEAALTDREWGFAPVVAHTEPAGA